ncbi:hypothetical protein NP493_1554g00020 [Ridgeia piscesae]|uniref:Uncharacterized protein n=1 Tax=Ridgeia piscesae TaxID=27915 RepID=A0AAD9NAX8_RIDPI|nr:hypothetical protein NP493_1554g00020 [Ridgeia piscesae]
MAVSLWTINGEEDIEIAVYSIRIKFANVLGSSIYFPSSEEHKMRRTASAAQSLNEPAIFFRSVSVLQLYFLFFFINLLQHSKLHVLLHCCCCNCQPLPEKARVRL